MLHNRFDRSLARGKAMEPDTDRIDAAVLALLLLGLHNGCRVWKTFDWDAMNRLHEKGFISDPVGCPPYAAALLRCRCRGRCCRSVSRRCRSRYSHREPRNRPAAQVITAANFG